MARSHAVHRVRSEYGRQLRIAAIALGLGAALVALLPLPAAGRPMMPGCACAAVRPGGEDDSTQYNKVVRLKSGEILTRCRVRYEPENDRFIVRFIDGSERPVLARDVLVVETYERTFGPPAYLGYENRPIPPCDERTRGAYFLEARLWAMATGRDESASRIGIDGIAFGPEAAGGLRFGRWGAGIGVSWFRSRGISRVPVFLHGRYQLTDRCLAPFVYAQFGTVYDARSHAPITLSGVFGRTPTIAGIGAGIDVPLSRLLDASVDLGWRFLSLPTRVPCDCSTVPAAGEAIFFNRSHGVILRAGVTF